MTMSLAYRELVVTIKSVHDYSKFVIRITKVKKNQ